MGLVTIILVSFYDQATNEKNIIESNWGLVNCFCLLIFNIMLINIFYFILTEMLFTFSFDCFSADEVNLLPYSNMVILTFTIDAGYITVPCKPSFPEVEVTLIGSNLKEVKGKTIWSGLFLEVWCQFLFYSQVSLHCRILILVHY